MHSCDAATAAPLTLSPAYKEREAPVAASQLTKARPRLATLLNDSRPSKRVEACKMFALARKRPNNLWRHFGGKVPEQPYWPGEIPVAQVNQREI